MKGEGKMKFKSKMKWVVLVGLILSVFSLLVHILLARFTEEGISEYQSSITIFSWRPIFENADFPKTVCNVNFFLLDHTYHCSMLTVMVKVWILFRITWESVDFS